MATWTFDFPGHTARLNELLGHRGKAARLKARDRELVGLAFLLARIPKA